MPYTLPDASVIWNRQERMEAAVRAAMAFRAALQVLVDNADPCPFEGYDTDDFIVMLDPPAPGYIERTTAASFGLVEVAA